MELGISLIRKLKVKKGMLYRNGKPLTSTYVRIGNANTTHGERVPCSRDNHLLWRGYGAPACDRHGSTFGKRAHCDRYVPQK